MDLLELLADLEPTPAEAHTAGAPFLLSELAGTGVQRMAVWCSCGAVSSPPERHEYHVRLRAARGCGPACGWTCTDAGHPFGMPYPDGLDGARLTDRPPPVP